MCIDTPLPVYECRFDGSSETTRGLVEIAKQPVGCSFLLRSALQSQIRGILWFTRASCILETAHSMSNLQQDPSRTWVPFQHCCHRRVHAKLSPTKLGESVALPPCPCQESAHTRRQLAALTALRSPHACLEVVYSRDTVPDTAVVLLSHFQSIKACTLHSSKTEF